MINIVLDFYGLSSGEMQDIVVENEQQYVDSRLKIREASRKGSNLTVVVRNTKIANWYESLKDYSDSIIKVKSLSPKSILVEKLDLESSLSMSVPLSDTEIIELNLLERTATSPPKSRLVTPRDVESWILSACIDKCWGEMNPTLTHFSKVISYFLSGEKEPTSPSGLRELIDKRKGGWVSSSIGDAYSWLFKDPINNSFLVYVLQALGGYEDSMKQKILAEIGTRESIQPITKYINQISPCQCSDEIQKKGEFSDLIEIKWKNSLRGKFQFKIPETEQTEKDKILKERFEQIINDAAVKMSGKIIGEIDALQIFIKENPLYFNERLFNLIGAKFGHFSELIKELQALIPPNIPSLPVQDWDWEKMTKWVTKEYLPYVSWSLKHIEEGKLIEEYAKAYSDWLYDQYPKMKNELVPLNYGTWHVIKDYLSNGYQILWIIIDNLCWFYIEDIRKAFGEQGFYPSSFGVMPQLSMLPSETRISKTALVAGKLPCQIEVDKYQKYQELFEQRCKESGIDSYRAMPDYELKTSKLGGDKITCCILNKLDVSSHQGFFDFEDDVRNFLSNIAKYVKSFIPPDAALRKFCLVVSTDHGSCTIPNYIKGYRVPKAAEMEEEHKRFIYIDSNEALEECWYFLDKDKFGLTRSIAIAKGYGFIGTRKPKGLVHGGMTPEETFIPLLEFCLEPLQIEGIKCIHNGQPIHLSPRKQEVELLIRNPNRNKITNIKVFIPSSSIEISLDEILGNDEKPKVIEISLPKEETSVSKGNIATLKGYYSFECLGEKKSGETEIGIGIRRIIEVSEAEERLLEF